MRYIREIRRIDPVTPVPGTADMLAGIVALRGEILAVFDLGVALGRGPTPLDSCRRLIVCGLAGPEFAFPVEEADALAVLAGAELPPPPAVPDDSARRLVRGVTGTG